MPGMKDQTNLRQAVAGEGGAEVVVALVDEVV
jgi:hypothetical protein